MYKDWNLTITSIIYIVFLSGKALSVTSLAAAKVENTKLLDKFERKARSLIHNQGNQCYATTVLHYLLSMPDFREQIALLLKSPTNLKAIYLSKLHLMENVGEDYLLKLTAALNEAFLDKEVQHDAAEFAELLLSHLDLPPGMFEVFRQETVRCANPDCAHEYSQDDQRLGKYF